MDDTTMPATGAAKELLDRARAAWKRVKGDETFYDWVAIGEGLQWCRSEALRRSRSNDMDSHAAKLAMAEILREEGLEDIDKSIRSLALKMMADLPAIEAWRRELHQQGRLADVLRWNSPRAILDNYRAYLKKQHDADADDDPLAALRAKSGLTKDAIRSQKPVDVEEELREARSEIVRLTAENERLRMELAVLRRMPAQEAAEVFGEHLEEPKAEAAPEPKKRGRKPKLVRESLD